MNVYFSKIQLKHHLNIKEDLLTKEVRTLVSEHRKPILILFENDINRNQTYKKNHKLWGMTDESIQNKDLEIPF